MPDAPETIALRAALDAANRDRDATRARLTETEGRLRTETGSRFAAQESALATSLSQAETQSTVLQDQLEGLLSEGNFKEAAARQRDLAANEARLAQLRGQKDWIDQQKTQAANQPAAADPLERFNSTERTWIEQNPRYLSDPAFQRKVNAVAQHATEIDGVAKDSPEYFKRIEEAVYPERRQTQQRADGGQADDDGQSEPAPMPVTLGTDPLEQQHEMSMPVSAPNPDAPAMMIDLKPEQPQPRAAGPGADSVRAIAAPPSRRIAAMNTRNAPSGRIEPTQKEVEMAVQLYNDIEPNAEDRSPQAAVRWYHALYSDPRLHRGRRRERWVYEGSAA